MLSKTDEKIVLKGSCFLTASLKFSLQKGKLYDNIIMYYFLVACGVMFALPCKISCHMSYEQVCFNVMRNGILFMMCQKVTNVIFFKQR